MFDRRRRSRRAAPCRRAAGTAAILALLAAACTGGPSPSPSVSGGPALVLRIAPAPFALAAPVQREVAVAARGALIIAGGLDTGGASVNGVFSMNPGTGALVHLGSVPQPFHDAAGAVLGHRLLVFGGGAASSTSDVQSFDLSTHRGRLAGHLPRPISDLSAATVDGTVYLVGGFDGTNPQPTVYATTDGARFRLAARLPVGLRYAAVTAVGSILVVAGGVSAAGTVSTVYAVDTRSGRVATIGRLASPVAHAAAFTMGGRAYVVGGQDGSGAAVGSVTAVDPAARRVTRIHPLGKPLSDAAVAEVDGTAWLLGGWRGEAVAQVLTATLVRAATTGPAVPSSAAPTGTAGDASTRPFAGLLLVADRGNNRLLVMDANKNVVWRYPDPSLPPPPFRFFFPDDAFWVHGGHAILLNEEENDVLAEIAFPGGQTIWTYGHPGVAGSRRGYLYQPDDVYPYPGGGVTVADALNCRILFFGPGGRPTRQIGTTGSCAHGLPRTVGYANGDTPLPNGDLLLSELDGGYVDQVTASGHVVWSVKVPGVPVPSDPQMLPDGSFLVVDYARPGAVVRFTRTGKVLWSYAPRQGHGMLDHPSLGAPLPNGLVAVNDDYNDRVVIIDPATNQIVWQYGGRNPRRMHIPDGLDLLLPGGVVPLHADFASTEVRMGRP